MRVIICLFIFLYLFVHSAFPDALELENGDRITGKIIQMNEDTVTVKAEYGTLVIKRAYIKKGLFAVQASVPKQGLILELLFAGNLADTSPNKRKVANFGATFSEGKDGSASSAIAADGTGQLASITKAPDVDSINSFTISFWFNVKNETKSQYLLSKWGSTSGNQADGKFAVLYKSGFVSCYIVDSNGAYHTIKSEEAVEANKWNHAVFMCDCEKGMLYLFINGKKANEKNYEFGALLKSESPLYLLTATAQNDPKLAFYNTIGAMDNLRVYDRALTQAELAALYNELSGN
jgi:hypothetical protein